MFLALQTLTVFLVAVAMSLSLAHALELPGKLRLDKEAYMAVQTIYYPGFTIGGLFGEPIGLLAALALLIATPVGAAPFWWTLGGFAALVVMHASYWVFTHPVNRFWLTDQPLDKLGAAFFGFDPTGRAGPQESGDQALWQKARDRWEYSHVLRAVLAAASLVALVIAVAL